MNKGLLIFGGIVVLAVVVLYAMRQKQANILANSPGSPGYYGGARPVTSAATDRALGGLIASVGSSAAAGIGSVIRGSFGSNPGGNNDPGMEIPAPIDYSGDNNSYLTDNNVYDSQYDPSAGYDFSYA
jgi:hypothetical protein